MPSAAWLEEVKRALQHIRASDATEVEVAHSGFRLRLKRRPGLSPQWTAQEAHDKIAPTGSPIIAPLTGVFYRASSPSAQPYVSEGEEVQPETVVGLIETMKIFNEVLSERRGRVREILVHSGQLVHAGDSLMMVDESAETDGLSAPEVGSRP